MLTWLGKSSDELKSAIRSGELQGAYREMFQAPAAAETSKPSPGH